MARASKEDTQKAARPSLREQQKRLTRQRLLEAAEAVFKERGYAHTTIDDIVEYAGASRGTYYLYFKNKSGLLADLLGEFNEEAAILFQKFADIDEPDAENLAEWCASHIQLYRAHRHVIAAWIQAESAEPDLRPTADGYLNVALDTLSEHIGVLRHAEGLSDDAAEVRLRATLMMVQLERLCYFALIRRWKTDLDAAARLLGEIWLQTIYSGDVHE